MALAEPPTLPSAEPQPEPRRPGVRTKQRVLPARSLHPTDYGRPIRPHWVTRLVREWDKRKQGVLLVSQRADDRFYTMTGNHRVAAKLATGETDYAFDCLVYTGLTLAEEAAIYLSQDSETLRHTVADDFPAMLLRGDETAAGVDRVVRSLDLTVARYSGDGWAPHRVRAVGALLSTYDTCGEANLYEALKLVRDVWGDLQIKLGGRTKKTIYSEAVLASLPAFFRLYPDAERDWLRHAMGREGLSGFEERWIGHRTASKSRPQGGVAIVYGVLSWLDMYNYGRREKNLLDETVARRASKMLKRRPRRGPR